MLTSDQLIGKSVWNKSRGRFLFADLTIPEKPQFFQSRGTPYSILDVGRIANVASGRGGTLGLVNPGKVQARERLEVADTMFTITDTMTAPTVGKYPFRLIAIHDLVDHAGHESEVIGTESTGDPQFRIGPMPAFFSVCRYCNPIGVCLIHILPCSMWVRAENNGHVHLPASTDHITQRIGRAQPVAPVM